jgi:all-trans-retinol 13,14-reductase
METTAFDAVVIGAGLGGLTAAALLSKAGRKVCVIERNHAVGGAASAFKKGSLVIEPALHQTADPRDPNEPKHAILSELGLLDDIEWVPVNPFFSVRGGLVGEVFDLPVGFEAARIALGNRFPASRHGFERLIETIETAQSGVALLSRAGAEHSAGKLLRAAIELRGMAMNWRASLDEVLRRHVGDDEAAKFAIAGNLAYYSDDPTRMAWPFFAMAQGGYLKSGGVFIKGGSRVLSMRLAKLVVKAGGSLLLGREAVGVDLDGEGRPAFVRHADPKNKAAEESIGARQVFANCAPNILAQMLPPSARGPLERAYGGCALSTSLFTAHFGVNGPLAKFGLDRYGTVVVPDWMKSLRELPQGARMFAANPADKLPLYAIANYSAIDSGFSGDGPSQVSVVGVDRFDNWAALTPQEERDRRERWLDAFQAALDRDYPGLGAAVSERMFLNARSMRNFLNTPDGAIYGFAPLPPKRGIWAGVPRSPKTPIPAIYLASSFAGSGGFTGAMLSGASAARMAMAGHA